MEFVLRRVLVRSRRRKPRPPMWWLDLGMVVWFVALAIWNAVLGNWLSLASNACLSVLWWRGLHSPPVYWDRRAFTRWWPIGMALAIAGVFVR